MATDSGEAIAAISRKEKRKLLKKEKRKQVRKEIAIREKAEEESRWNDSEVQCKLRQLEQEELERMERDRLEFEERERRFLEALERKKKREQEEFEQQEERERERQKLSEDSGAKQVEEDPSKEIDEGSEWEYVEEGPAEIIWQGNEIIVKKKRVKVPKKNMEHQNSKEDVVRPISNPLAPQSESFETYKNAQEILDTVAQQVPHFGTEQDKAHCPFHLKTGACRFGTRCSRVHFYPDKSCTILMKNMYGGPGLAWDQDEGLELHTDEEIDFSFEEFYEDVHTEFLKFGEIMNFKVCRNGSPHLRGNVYVHYQFLESAVRAYQSTNGRYFAGKQVICEFVNVTRWKVAICGEFMKSRLKRCSRGSACNFIHCFRNPGGDYEWADWDRPPPRYWIEKMTALFGYEDGYNNQLDELNHDNARSITQSIHMDANRRHLRSRSREPDRRHTRSHNDDDDRRSNGQQWRHFRNEREHSLDIDRNEEMCGKGNHYIRGKSPNFHSDDDQSIRESKRIKHGRFYPHKKNHTRSRWHSKDRSYDSDSDRGCAAKVERERYHEGNRSRRRSKGHSNGRSPGSDSGKERPAKDERRRDRKDRTHSRQKKRDSCNTDYEYVSKDETLQSDPEGHYYHEDTLQKHHKCAHNSVKHQDDVDTCSSDSDGDSMLKNGEGSHMKRRKTSRWLSNERGFSDDDDVGNGYDRCENEYYRQKERSNLETVSKKTDLSEYSHDFHRDKHGKGESSKHRKREKNHKSEITSRRHRKDVDSNVTLFGKEEGLEKTHKGRTESLWDQDEVEDHDMTAHHEREICKEREKYGRLEDAKIDEGNGGGHTSQNTMSGEKTGDGHLSGQEYSVDAEIENEKACRCAALEKLQEKQLQKQLTSNCGNLKNPKTSSCNLEDSVVIRMVDEEQNHSEAEARKRRRI